MGHIKEPKGIDFLIKSEPLDNEGRKEISEFIKKYKMKKSAGKKVKAKVLTS